MKSFRRKKQRRPVDDWLMTYADMITLLLCFFIVIAATSYVQLKDEKKKEAEKKTTLEKIAPQDIEPLEKQLARLHLEEKFPIVPVQPDVPVVGEQVVLGPPLPPELLEAEKEREKPPLVAKVMTAEELKGDRISVIEMNSTAVFASGAAELSEEGQAKLHEIAEQLKDPKYTDYQITVEGHTDDNPISTPLFPSNWELSTARAAAVVRFFLQEGIPAQKLRAAGYANTFPKLPNRDEAGNPIESNQAQNRRVVIKLEKIDRQNAETR